MLLRVACRHHGHLQLVISAYPVAIIAPAHPDESDVTLIERTLISSGARRMNTNRVAVPMVITPQILHSEWQMLLRGEQEVLQMHHWLGIAQVPEMVGALSVVLFSCTPPRAFFELIRCIHSGLSQRK